MPKDVQRLSVRHVAAEIARFTGQKQCGPALLRQTQHMVRYFAKLYRQDPYAFVLWLNRHNVLP